MNVVRSDHLPADRQENDEQIAMLQRRIEALEHIIGELRAD